LALAITSIATLGVLTACAGPSLPDTGSASSLKDGVAGAPEAPAPPEQGPQPVQDAQRDVVKTASMTIRVSNTSEAADKAAVMVEDSDDRVDSRSEDAGSDRGLARTSVVLRVPVSKLDGVVRDLKTLGSVQTAETRSEDVTTQRVDMDARIKALQTSVDRLLAIMRDAKDPEALISAENALSQRQADLDSLRAQRDALGDRIEYRVAPVASGMEQVFKRFLIERMGAQVAKEGAYGSKPDDRTFTLPGCDHVVAVGAHDDHVGLFAPPPKEPPWVRCQDSIRQIATAFDAELATGRLDDLFVSR
jgi:hypothetical protein